MHIYCIKSSDFNGNGMNYEYLTHEREISGKDFHGMVKKVAKIINESEFFYTHISVAANMMCERYGFQMMKPLHTMNMDWIPNEYEEEDGNVHL